VYHIPGPRNSPCLDTSCEALNYEKLYQNVTAEYSTSVAKCLEYEWNVSEIILPLNLNSYKLIRSGRVYYKLTMLKEY
jgi:hypothetical protein